MRLRCLSKSEAKGVMNLPGRDSAASKSSSHPQPHVVLEVQGLGITLVWDTKDFLMITADGPLWDHTAGLCGSLNGNPYNDFAMGDGSSGPGVGAWVESWTSPNTQPGPDGRPGSSMCEGGRPEHPCTPGSEEGERATRFCRNLLER